MNDRVAKALAVLQEEGWRIELRPSALVVNVGRLSIDAPGEGPIACAGNVTIRLDGVNIEKFTRRVRLTMEAGSVAEAELELGVFP